MDLGSRQTFNTVTLYGSTANPSMQNNCYSFPKDFKLEVSTDGENWTKVYEKTNCEIPSFGPVNCKFDTVTARYVKLTATSLNPKPTENNAYRLQLSEMQISNSGKMTLATPKGDDIVIDGYQISPTLKGLRTVYSVEPTIQGKDVINVGLVYSLSDYASENDLYVGSQNTYVQNFDATYMAKEYN